MKRNWNKTAWLPVTVGVLLMPLVLGDGYYLNIMNFIALYAMVTLGLCLLTGYGGQLSISHSAFFAIGAYSSAVFSLRLGLNPIIAILLSQGVAALVAWGIGAVVLRLKSHYLAIATLSFTIIVEVLIKEMAWLTGGLQGLSGIPPISLGGLELDSDWRFYYLIWPVTLALLLFALNLVDSRWGRVFRAIKEGEDVARLFGVKVKSCKVRLFVLSSIYASLAGSLYAHYVTFVSPVTGSVMFAIDIIMVLAFGGFTLLWGGMLGVASLTMLNEYLTVFADYKRAIYGLALVVIMLFFPNGLLQGIKDGLALMSRSLKRGSA